MGDSESDFEIKLHALRKKYLDRCRERVAAANTWVRKATSDSSAVRKLHAMAHEMAGSGATYGFPGITVVADGLERFLEPIVTRGEPLETEESAETLDQMVRELEDVIPDQE